jgi:putative tryptophan/tyrosine transport system substrate-binding protein
VSVWKATSEAELKHAFAEHADGSVNAVLVNVDRMFLEQRKQIAALAAKYAIPAMYTSRQYVEAGGLMSYGTNRLDIDRQAGLYIGRILKGETPAGLPVQRSTKIELVINLKTAKTLGLTIPEALLATADEVLQ